MTKSLAEMPRATFPEDYQLRPGSVLAQAALELGPIFARDWAHGTVVYMVGPEANRFVMLEGREVLSHEQGWTPIIGDMLGRGLLNMDGAEHAAQRKLMNPAFVQEYMDRYLPIMNRVIDERIFDWGSRGLVDVYDEARKITFDVAAETLAGFQPGAEVDEFRRLFTTLLVGDPNARTDEEMFSSYTTARDTLARRMMQKIHERRQNPTDDVLGMLVKARDAEGRALSDEQLLGHVNILLVAGHETSTSLSAWMLYLLALHSDYTLRIRQELAEVLPNNAEPTLEAAKQLKVLGYALSEAERLYPPVAYGPRGASRDFEFGGYLIPKGQRVLYSIAGSHRLPSIWQNPDAFDPDRFAPPREEDKKHPYALVGFGGGPRVCIGINFATVEMKAMVAKILQRYDLEPDPEHTPRQWYEVTGGPMNGIKLRVRSR